MTKDDTIKYIIPYDKFNDFWDNVMNNDDPFHYMDITYYEHDYVKNIYVIKVKDV